MLGLFEEKINLPKNYQTILKEVGLCDLYRLKVSSSYIKELDKLVQYVKDKDATVKPGDPNYSKAQIEIYDHVTKFKKKFKKVLSLENCLNSSAS